MDRRILPVYTLSANGSSYSPFAPDGVAVRLEEYTYTSKRMGTTEITATLKHASCLDDVWTGREFVQWSTDGERLFLLNTPSSEKTNDDARYIHTLTFQSERDAVLNNVYFVDCVLPGASSADRFLSNSTTVRFPGTLAAFVQRINDVMRYRGLDESFVVTIEEGITTEDKFVEFEDRKIFEALQDAYDLWDIPFYFDGNHCIFGYGDGAEDVPEVNFEYGRDNQLISIRRNNDNAKVVTRCSGIGNSENIPYYYPNPTPKGTLGVEVGGNLSAGDVTVVDQSKFGSMVSMGGSLDYSDIRVTFGDINFNMAPSGWVGKKDFNGLKTGYPDTGWFKFTISRGNDSGATEIFVAPELKMTIEKMGIGKLYPSDTRVDLPEWARQDADDPKTLHNGLIALTYRFIRSDAWSSSKRYTSDDCAGSGETIFSLTSPYGYEDYNDGDILRSYKASLDNLVVGTHEESKTTGGRKPHTVTYTIKDYANVLDYNGFPVRMLISLKKNQTREIIVNYNLTGYKDGMTGGCGLMKAAVSLGDEEVLAAAWRLDGSKINLSDVGLSLAEGKTPRVGDWITQVCLNRVPGTSELRPSVYRETNGMGAFYPAVNSAYTETYPDGTTHTFGPYEDESGNSIVFNNVFVATKPREHIEKFEDIKPTIKGCLNADAEAMNIISAVYYEEGYDPVQPVSDENTEAKYPLFFVKLRPTNGTRGFNIFESASATGEMSLTMLDGSCGSCTFKVASIETEDGRFVNPVLVTTNQSGAVVPDVDEATGMVKLANVGGEQASQQDSRNGIWIGLMPDRETYGGSEVEHGVLPAAESYLRVKSGDSFTIINITLPEAFILDAEDRLEKAVIKFMKENNDEKFTYSVNFSRDWLAVNDEIRDRLSEHSALHLKYNGETLPLMYVESYTYKMSQDALPEISVELGDVIEVQTSGTQEKIDAAVNEAIDASGVGNVRAAVDQYFLRKDKEDVAQEKIGFAKGFTAGDYERDVKGAAMTISDNGISTMELDYLRVRKKAVFNEVDIDRLKHSGGQIAVSCASGTISSVEAVEGGYMCRFNSGSSSDAAVYTNEFEVGDLAMCQRFGGSPRFWWRKVTSVGSDYIIVSDTIGADNSDVPAEGDVAVQFGNVSDTGRQSVQILSCQGDDSPSYKVYSGVNGFSLTGKDIASLSFDSELGEPKLCVYGAMHLGDRDGSQYMRYYTNDAGERVLEINGAALANLISVRNADGTVVAGINGSASYSSQSGKKIMLFAGSEGSSLENVRASKFLVYEDGSVVAKEATLDGGTIGCFSIDQGLHYNGYTSASINSYFFETLFDNERNEMFLMRKMSNGTSRSVGKVTLPSNSATSSPLLNVNVADASGEFSDSTPVARFSANTGNGVAIEVPRGQFLGFRPKTILVTSSSTIDTYTSVVIDTSNTSSKTVTLTLPSDPQVGQSVRVIKRYANGVMVVSAGGKTIFRANAASGTSTTFANGKKGSADYTFDGTAWQQILLEYE